MKKKISHKIVKQNEDEALLLEANIDDQSAERLAAILPILIDAGAYDVFFYTYSNEEKSFCYTTKCNY
ncbi:nickel insertion protein [Apilactobacillus ozensis]|uniref:nickel insertion protein n=1 Tax=Apilactobacillus ozensis TaxID=866801 RepID=UPI0020939613|nr:nickel insertion protein [Apilactobacillus ozensis]